MFLADGFRLVAQTIINLPDESEPVLAACEGGVWHKPKQVAMRHGHTVSLKQELGDTGPLQIILDRSGGDAESAILLSEMNDRIEIRAFTRLTS
jgi:hypothetical protein